MAASAFAKGHGGMSLGQQWGLAAMLRDDSSAPSGGHSPKTLEQILEEDRERAKKLAALGFHFDIESMLK